MRYIQVFMMGFLFNSVLGYALSDEPYPLVLFPLAMLIVITISEVVFWWSGRGHE